MVQLVSSSAGRSLAGHRGDSASRGSFHAGPADTAQEYTDIGESGYVSEYQYYEFQAIDQPLGEADREALRELSSRADITPTRFTNEYHFGDFHGNPRKLMERWFDLHLYHASWGTRTIMIRIPKQLLDASRLDEFISEVDEVKLHAAGKNVIVEISFNSEESGHGYGGDGVRGLLDELAPLRNDLLAGDLRLFYILWLTALERDFFLPDRPEPLPGIGPLSAPLAEFARFFRVDRDLMQAAAASPGGSDGDDLVADVSRQVIQSIPEDEKSALLLRLANGDPHVAPELRNRIRAARAVAEARSGRKRRTVAEIRKRSLAVGKERKAAAAKKQEERRRREAQEAARAQRARLDSMKRRGDRVWNEVEREIEYKNSSSYDRATGLLVDLRTLAQEEGAEVAFESRVQSVRERHARKLRFIERLDGQGIGLG